MRPTTSIRRRAILLALSPLAVFGGLVTPRAAEPPSSHGGHAAPAPTPAAAQHAVPPLGSRGSRRRD
jgi:hypothetical protein